MAVERFVQRDGEVFAIGAVSCSATLKPSPAITRLSRSETVKNFPV